MDTNKLAKEILENVGGKNNIKDVTHCFTRLRFILKDESKAEKDIINHLEGVIQVVVSGGQFQVVLGSKVTKVYDALLPMVDLDENARGESEEKGNLFNRILQVVSKMFTPLIPAIAASGLISGALTAVKLSFTLLRTEEWISGSWCGIWPVCSGPGSSCGRSACGTRPR